MRRLLAVLLAGIFSLSAFAQTGFHNFDVASGFTHSTPLHLTAYKGKLYFYGNGGNTGRELFSVEGTNSAQLTKNLNPTSANALGVGYISPIIGFGSKVYYTATNGASGEELFSYDGNTDPKLVADLTFGPDSSMPDNYVLFNNKIYFNATTAANGRELYSYDTMTTPKRVTDINVGADNSVFGPIVVFANRIFFIANTPANGSELWSYNPATDTAVLEADINTGTNSSNPANLTVLNNTLYFSATSFTHGRELYKYDGVLPPKRLTDISASGLSSLSPVPTNAFALFGNKVYFAARDTSGERHVWNYDPSNDNVALVAKINPNGSSDPKEFIVYNSRLFFTANDGANGFELFAYDGTNAPAIVGDICQGPNSSLPSYFTVIGDELYFSADDCVLGTELMSYNYKRVGIKRVLFDADVKIYPNPVQKELHIDMNLKNAEQLSITVADAAGRVIYDGDTLPYSAGKHKTNIPMRNLPAGNYIYYIRNQHGTAYMTGKVVKQ